MPRVSTAARLRAPRPRGDGPWAPPRARLLQRARADSILFHVCRRAGAGARAGVARRGRGAAGAQSGDQRKGVRARAHGGRLRRHARAGHQLRGHDLQVTLVRALSQPLLGL